MLRVLLLAAVALGCAANVEQGECGDGVVDVGEECDDGNTSSTDRCTNLCRRASCGDGYMQEGEECDDGPLNSNETSGACRTSCVMFKCGDDVADLEHGEECDYGEDNSDEIGNACRTTCLLPICGDGVIDAGEECDDANLNPNDACDACVASKCGDGVQELEEGCDDGNRISGDGCSGDCFEELVVCGDSHVQADTESCDDGNHIAGDCCDPDCHAEPGCELEPNDVITGAPDFEAIAIAGGVNAIIFPATDEDVYPFTIAPGQRLAIYAGTSDGPLGSTCNSFAIESELELWDVSDPALPKLIAADLGRGRCSAVRATGIGPGDYMIKVRAWPFDPVSFDYRLNVTLGPVLLETEPNDTADPLLPEYEIGALVEADLGPDPDWFRLELSGTASDLALETSTPPGPGTCVDGIHTRLELRGDTGELIASDAGGGVGHCSFLDARIRPEVSALPPGTYYVGVYDDGSTSGARRYVFDTQQIAACGDGQITGTEQCDDGGTTGGDGCSARCRRE